MTEMVRDLGQYLIDSVNISGFGVDLFLGYNPDDPDNIVVLAEYDSKPGFGEVALKRRVQIIVRDADYQTGLQRIWSIYNALIKYDEFIIYTNNRYLIPTALQAPVPMSVDDRGRQSFVFNLSITTTKDY